MFIVYIVVTVLAAAANMFSATLDFIRYKQILINMARVGVSESWLATLGILKAAGAFGLLVGIRVPLIGIAAAIGLVLFYRSHHHPSTRARLLLRSGGRISPAGPSRINIASDAVVSRASNTDESGVDDEVG
jgi:DoxX-like family